MKRALSKEAIVIADGLNYIKGYRYQLWCEAKAAGTRCCVVHVAASEDECRGWNNQRVRWQNGTAEEEVPCVERTTEEDEQATRPPGYGELQPESHTAIYGDRVVPRSRSRSSSLDIQLDDPPAAPSLKSLYLPVAHGEEVSFASLSLNDNADQASSPAPVPDTISTSGAPHLPYSNSLQPAHIFPPSSPPYSAPTLASLMLRYEPPSPFSRWDTPLFTVPSTDPHPPYSQIWSALFPAPVPRRKATVPRTNGMAGADEPVEETKVAEEEEEVKPHAATVLPKATPAEALQVLERTTQDVVTALYAAYRDAGIEDEGGYLTISLAPGSSTMPPFPRAEEPVSLTISIPSNTRLSTPQLQRLRRKFGQIQRGAIAHGQDTSVAGGPRGVAEAFGRFLQDEFGT